MKFIRILKAGHGASLLLTNFDISFTEPIKIEESNYGYRGIINPNSIKINYFDIYDSENNFLVTCNGRIAKVISADLTFGYTIGEAVDNGDNPIKVDTLIQNKSIEGYIGRGKWTWEYLNDHLECEVNSDDCIMDFDYGYRADLSIWLKLRINGFALKDFLNNTENNYEIYN